MAIDRKRLTEFRQRLDALFATVSFEERWRTVAAKILDMLSRDAFRKLSAIERRQAIQRLFRPENARFVDAVFDAFENVLKTINELYSDLGVDVNRDFSKIRAIERISLTQLGDYEDGMVKAILRELREAITRNENVKQVTRRLGRLGGRASFYAETLARTQLKGYGRTAKAEKARLGEVFFYEYVGILRPTTRPFCESLIGTTHHIDQINEMRNGNLEPVLLYCGGWNCYHDWEPDPFATQSTLARLQEIGDGKRKLVVRTEANLPKLVEDYREKFRKK